MKSDRLLSILLLLQARGRATERELAQRLEVSQRTVHRDLESLSASGVPVLALRGSRGWWDTGEDCSVLPLLQEAVAGQRRMAFDYVRADGTTGPRTVHPLGLVAKGASWYLVAQTSAGMRTFRVSRMTNAAVLASGFERPARFDLADYWARTTAELERRRGMFSIVVAAAPEAAQRIRMHRPTMTMERSRKTRNILPGWTLLRVDFEEEIQARFVVLGLGALVRALEPPGFRRSIAAEIRSMAHPGSSSRPAAGHLIE
jgi:predicted DNA-binding transcriptional regulator YafY